MPAQGVGDQLVSKAHAHEFFPPLIQLCHEGTQVFDPRLVIVDAEPTSGHKIGVAFVDAARKNPVLNPVRMEDKLIVDLSQQFFKHFGIIPEFMLELWPHGVTLENANFHLAAR